MDDFYELQTFDFKRTKGDSISLNFNFVDKNGALINITDWDSKFTLKNPITNEDILNYTYPEKLIIPDYVTDTFTCVGHGFLNKEAVVLSTDGILPAGLSLNTIYYIWNRTDDTFQLKIDNEISTPIIDFTGPGTGNQYASHYVELQKYHDDSVIYGKGIYYNGDVQSVPQMGLSEYNQLVVILDYKDTAWMEDDIYPFDLEFTMTVTGKIYKYTAVKGNLILAEEITDSV